MSSDGELTEEEVEAWFEQADCVKTDRKTDTGTVWRALSGRHFILPFSKDGYYPHSILHDLDLTVGKISTQYNLPEQEN